VFQGLRVFLESWYGFVSPLLRNDFEYALEFIYPSMFDSCACGNVCDPFMVST